MELWTEKEKEMILFGYSVGVLAGRHAKEHKKEFGVDLENPAEALMCGQDLIEHEAAEIYKTFKPGYDMFMRVIKELEDKGV